MPIDHPQGTKGDRESRRAPRPARSDGSAPIALIGETRLVLLLDPIHDPDDVQDRQLMH